MEYQKPVLKRDETEVAAALHQVYSLLLNLKAKNLKDKEAKGQNLSAAKAESSAAPVHDAQQGDG